MLLKYCVAAMLPTRYDLRVCLVPPPCAEGYATWRGCSLPQLGSSDLAPGGSFVNMYKKIAARKFFFFIDGARRSKLLIRDVLLHPVLSELMELRQDEPDEVAPANWFLPDNARRVYTLFMKLDRDRNGTLSKTELAAWNDGGLTPIFVDRGTGPLSK